MAEDIGLGDVDPILGGRSRANVSKGKFKCSGKAWLVGIGILVIVAVAVVVPSCAVTDWCGLDSSGDTSANVVPLVKPPVQSAVPTGLNGAATTLARMHLTSFSAADVKDRFFNTEGPTELFQLLASLDGRIAGINSRASRFSSCLGTEPTVSIDIPVWSQNATLWMQCGEDWGEGFIYFARKNDTFYLFENGGETRMLAHVYLLANATAGNITNSSVDYVELWYSVGNLNTNGSHAVVHLLARPAEQVFEMVAAGKGIGFCGAQIRSANGTMNVTASSGDGACDDTASICTLANDTAIEADCSDESKAFELAPLGRLAYGDNAASAYPGEGANNVALTVLGTDDDTHFGPNTYTL